MKRRIPNLAATRLQPGDDPDGVFLVRVDRVGYQQGRQKPFYSVQFSILEPRAFVGRCFVGRLYCTPKALWKLAWFLRDFGYDPDLLGRDEIDDRALVGLQGVVKVSHSVVNGRPVLNLDAFAPATAWDDQLFHPASVRDSELAS